MLALRFVIHFLVHVHLLGQRYLNPVSFLLQLSQSLSHVSVHGFELSQLVRPFLMLLEGSRLSVDDIVCQFARCVGELGPSRFAVFVRRKVVELGGRWIFSHSGHQQGLCHSEIIDKIYYLHTEIQKQKGKFICTAYSNLNSPKDQFYPFSFL